jgi:hypothetical protein
VRAFAVATATAVVLAMVLAPSATLADPDANHGSQGLTDPAILALIGNDDLFSLADLTVLLDPPGPNGTQHYGPYSSGSPDSGTCGNDWATDTFDRHFTVRQNLDGSFTVVQQFKNGSFVTNSPTQPSPGSCDFTDGSPPGTVIPGIVGSMHGYFIISAPFPQSSTSPYCNATTNTNTGCTTATFINTHFAGCAYPSPPCNVTTFFDHYSAGDQGLVEHEWKNASDDRGGNHGDIRST